MSCRRAFEVDLVGLLAEPGAEGFAEFRAHYPLCAECSAEVRAWTDLHVLLGASSVAADRAHPPPLVLARYEQRPSRLAPGQRREVEAHLAGCAPCRDELAALRAFDFSALPAAGTRVAPRPFRLAWWQRLRGVVLHPAFAYLLLAALLVPAAYLVVLRAPGGPDGLQTYAPRSEEELLTALERSDLAAARIRAPETPREADLERSVTGADARVARRDPSGIREAERRSAFAAAASGDPAWRAERIADGEGLLVRIGGWTSGSAGEAPARAVAAPPERAREGAVLEARILHGAGRRELRERFRADELGGPLEIRLPSNWDPHPRDRVELYDVGGSEPALLRSLPVEVR